MHSVTSVLGDKTIWVVKPSMFPDRITYLNAEICMIIIIQGGNWDSMISHTMAEKSPEHVRPIHVNFFPLNVPFHWQIPVPFSSGKKAYLYSVFQYLTKGSGYTMQQSTWPQTIGYALQDSQVAL